jgi:predicted nucleic acid-binding protein
MTSARQLFTTNYVLTEFVPLSEARGHDRKEAIIFLIDFLKVPRLELIWIEPQSHSAAMQLLQTRLDKSYSLCDGVSFIVMLEHGLTEALTTDKHFEQEGFIRLLK